jgi:hypothetical protein
MSATDRQNRLLLAEDWKKVYQSFRNADFQSYDFENLRRTMIDYIRQNYPEDFNDYIESSEYLALIDLIAFLGQSIAFRVDLNARENFLELAERRESVLRLARLISYNAKRTIAASGLLKFSTVQTTENILDSNGRNLSGQVISWNDPSNPNWYDQFIKVMNGAMSTSQQFGNPSDKATIYDIPTEQYRLESSNSGVPIFSFSKVVAGRSTPFEICSTTFTEQEYVYEEAPKVGNKLACIFRNDGRGYGSAGTGFFLYFTQGTTNTGTFSITQPSTTETVDIDSAGINDSDVWLYRLDKDGNESESWTKVSSLEGNNIIYNSLNKNIRNIYAVITRNNDTVSLTFGDGTFGNIPLGTFKVYYRVSNGLSYTINTQDIRNVSISIPYISNLGQQETLTVTLGLVSSVSNAETSETNISIKNNAPATYYTQNRMITGEDYNISPLSVSQQIIKVKSVNRSSSGISRYFDLVDPTGKYSSTRLYANDGALYKENYESYTRFSYSNRTDIEGVIYNDIYSILKKTELRNYYYSKYSYKVASSLNVTWEPVTVDSNYTTGYVKSPVDNVIYKVGSFTATDLKYFKVGSLVRFSAPTGQYFDTINDNVLKDGDGTAAGAATYIWAEVVSITDDGTALGTGRLSTGFGPIALNRVVPRYAIISQIIPKFRTTIETDTITTMNDLIFSNKPFGLRYDSVTQTWKIIFESNLNTSNNFTLGNQGDVTNKQRDSSWLLLFTTDNEFYTVTSRELRFIFESDQQLRFYFDTSSKIYDTRSNSLVKDTIKILSVNTRPDNTISFSSDFSWDVTSNFIGLDGYVDNKKIIVSFSDADENGVVDDPELFDTIIDPTTSITTKYIIQEKYTISQGQEDYKYVSNSDGKVLIFNSESDITSLLAYNDSSKTYYFYFIDKDVVKKLTTTGKLVPTLDYKVYVGRDNLKFEYVHSADAESRIDPGASNIIDIYVLTKNYDIEFRQWVVGARSDKPLPPSSDEIYNTVSPSLNLIKSISDEIIYHPVEYKVLFGQSAPLELQAIFKVTKTPDQTISDNDIKSKVINLINEFFALENWDFGDTFYFTELATYVVSKSAPYISNFVIVPRKSGLNFGSLFEIKASNNQLFISGATVNDIEIISGITMSNIKSVSGTTTDMTQNSQQLTSSTYGSI